MIVLSNWSVHPKSNRNYRNDCVKAIDQYTQKATDIIEMIVLKQLISAPKKQEKL